MEITKLLNVILDETKLVLFKPKEYVEKAGEQSIAHAVIKMLVYLVVAGIFNFIIGLIKPSAFIFNTGSFLFNFFLTPIAGIAGLFIAAVILMVFSAILGGSSDFKKSINILASLMAAYIIFLPVIMILVALGLTSLTMLGGVSVLMAIYSLWLMYSTFTAGLKTKPFRTKIFLGLIAAVLLFAAFMLSLIPGIMSHVLYEGGVKDAKFIITLDTSVPSGQVAFDKTTSTTTVGIKFGKTQAEIDTIKRFFKPKR
jgi:hypothetical protein